MVIFDKATYLSKMDIILSDGSDFVQLELSKRSNSIIIHDKVYRLVKDLHKNKVIEEEMNQKLTNSGS